MSKLAIIPFFGGDSSAAHSAKELRLDYLKQTVDNVKSYEFDIELWVSLVDDLQTLKALYPDLRVYYTSGDPRFLPYRAATSAQKYTEDYTHVLFTEADQVYTITSYPSDNNVFWSPLRLEELYEGVGHDRGLVVDVLGKTHVIPNITINHLATEVKYFGGGFLCTFDAFKSIKFIKSEELPVEHITGFSAFRSLQHQENPSFYCIHLSGLEYHKKLYKEQYGIQNK